MVNIGEKNEITRWIQYSSDNSAFSVPVYSTPFFTWWMEWLQSYFFRLLDFLSFYIRIYYWVSLWMCSWVFHMINIPERVSPWSKHKSITNCPKRPRSHSFGWICFVCDQDETLCDYFQEIPQSAANYSVVLCV